MEHAQGDTEEHENDQQSINLTNIYMLIYSFWSIIYSLHSLTYTVNIKQIVADSNGQYFRITSFHPIEEKFVMVTTMKAAILNTAV